MQTISENMPKTDEKQLVITRVFDAPRGKVWRAWTEPEQLKRWFGPTDFTIPVCTVNLRAGGGFHYDMRSPDGKDFWGKGVYREIKPLEKLVYSDSFSDKDGNTVSPTVYGFNADFPEESLITVTFEEREGKTRMTMVSSSPASKERDQAEAGWNESFDKLAEYLRTNG